MPDAKLDLILATARRRAEWADRGLLDYVQFMNPMYEVAPHHHLVAMNLERVEAHVRGLPHECLGERCTRLMIFIAPQHGKSELVSKRFPAWTLGRDKDARFILTSYAQLLADQASAMVRDQLQDTRYPYPVKPYVGPAAAWVVKGGLGGVKAAGRGGAVTGWGGRYIIIDDPVSNAAEADSPTMQEQVWAWYSETIRPRLVEPGAIILVNCMTGDTPVRMSDGTERPLHAIRSGDRVATYAHGTLTSAIVLKHASQGHDNIYQITMTSGATVRANARHPFLVDDGGQLRWIRLRDLTTDHRIVVAKASGANGRVASAPRMGAAKMSMPEVFAHPITRSKSGPLDTALLHRPVPPNSRGCGLTTSKSVTASLPRTTFRNLPLRAVSVLFASSHPAGPFWRTKDEGSVLTTTTPPMPCAGYFATTATSPSVTQSPKEPCWQWSNTSDFTTDRIASIDPAGFEEVFDVQIEGTENFIANGVVTHNTRWNYRDLSGRLEDAMKEGGEQWEILSLPALAEEGDVLGRSVGDALWPSRFPSAFLESQRIALGSRAFDAQYQQRPTPKGGNLIQTEWFKTIALEALPTDLRWCRYWDLAISTKTTADYTASCAVAFDQKSRRLFVRDMIRGRWNWPDQKRVIKRVMQEERELGTSHAVEEALHGTALLQELQGDKEVLGIPLYGVRPHRDKITRANPWIAMAEAGNLYLVQGSWIPQFHAECVRFPLGDHDDQVDALSGAIVALSLIPATHSEVRLGYDSTDPEFNPQKATFKQFHEYRKKRLAQEERLQARRKQREADDERRQAIR